MFKTLCSVYETPFQDDSIEKYTSLGHFKGKKACNQFLKFWQGGSELTNNVTAALIQETIITGVLNRERSLKLN